MDLNSSVGNISEAELNALFDDKSPLPSADQLKTGKDQINTGTDDKTKGPDIKNDQPLSNDIPIIDLEKLDLEDEKKEAKDDKKVEDKKNEPTEEAKKQISEVFKNTVNYLVEKGIWKDFDDRDKVEFTDELYAELTAKQAEEKVNDLFSELLDSTGEYGKAIISHIKNGGNPDEIIDIFKEQKAMENFDLANESSQKALISKYYSEIVGWKQDKIDKYIASISSEDEAVEKESKEIQGKYDTLYKAQLDEIKKEQQVESQQRAKQQQAYIDSLSKEIDNSEELTDADKKLIKNSALKFNKKLPDGTVVSDFYLKFQELQRDPKKYIKFVHYVMDDTGFEKKIQKKEEAKAVDKTWKFIKSNGAVDKKASAADDDKVIKTDFKGIQFKK